MIVLKNRPKILEEIDLLIHIGTYQFNTTVLKETTVGAVVQLIKNTKIHQTHGCQNSHFIGFASADGNYLIDYILSQHQLNFTFFPKKLALKALYSVDEKIDFLTINQFEFLKCLGKGGCGAVYLVRSKVTGKVFALKMLSKEIKEIDDIKSIINEKKIMVNLPSNNYTVTLHACFESHHHFNFLLDFYPGGELFVHICNEEKMLSQKDAKIYFCQVLAGLQFLHKNNVLYRDLKPENILVDLHGHLHIADFGLSKSGFKENDNALSRCGSPQYMAPEILQYQEYGFSCDFYSIGAILFQFITGYPPYYRNQRLKTQQKLDYMKKKPIDFRTVTKDVHLRVLLMGLLNPDSEKRINNFEEIKNNPWLAQINWRKIEQKSYKVPFIPEISKQYICSEFKDLQRQVEELNRYEGSFRENLQKFDYIKPESRKLLLGKQQNQPKELKKRIVKEKSSAKSSKVNLAISLFDQHDSNRESRNNTSKSNKSYETRVKKSEKENQCNKKESTQRGIKINFLTSPRIRGIESQNVSASKTNRSKQKNAFLKKHPEPLKQRNKLVENNSGLVKSQSKEKKLIGGKQLGKFKKDLIPMKIKLM